MLKNLLIVGAGGMLGSWARYLVYMLTGTNSFPTGTLFVNVIGSLVIGLITGLSIKSPGLGNEWRLFLATGICGGFTTFSAFSMDCVTMLQQSKYAMALGYILASILTGLTAAALGFWASRFISS